MDFTPKQLHYFKRELITLELQKEISRLIQSPDISSLLDEKQTINSTQQPQLQLEQVDLLTDKHNEFPLLRYIFHNVIIEFPLLKHTCDDTFWPKCKIFLNEFNKVQLSSFYVPRHTQNSAQRKAIKRKVQKSLVFAFCASIKTIQGKEESIRVTDSIDPSKQDQSASTANNTSQINQTFKTNIIMVRETKEKKTLRAVSHAEFIIETWFPNQTKPVYVARRHGEFRRFREQLKLHLKKSDIPFVPSKSNVIKAGEYRESDRLLLRAWLNQTISENLNIQNNAQLKKFLTDSPIKSLTEPEKEQALIRKQIDQHRLLEQERFQKELDKRVFELNHTLEELKKQVIEPGGLIRVFNTIKKTPNIQDLPVSLKKTLEWGKINFAFALHRQFITSDIATENCNNLRRTHGLMPYRTVGLILRFSNPMSIVKGILDLFLAQPFGGKSLFQRIIISNMNEESKALQRDIQILENKVDDKVICEKLYNAVRTELPKDSSFRDYPTATLELLALLDDDKIQPLLPAEQTAILANFDNDRTIKKLIKHAIQLWELYARQYEQELMLNLVFQGVTGELLKEFISVFYQPLAQVYKAADISTTIRHVSAFIDDLIQVIDSQTKTDSRDDEAIVDVSSTIQVFIDLVERHEQSFYEFVYNVHSQETSKVFDDLIKYVDMLFTFVANGIPGKIDMNHCIQKANITTRSDLDSLEKEIDSICDYRHKQKLYHFERTKRKMMLHSATETGLSKDENEIATDEKIFQYIPQRSEMIGVLDDLDELEYEDEEDNDKKETSSSSSSSSSTSNDDESLTSGSSLGSRRTTDSASSYLPDEAPILDLIPKIVPYFIEDVVSLMHS